MWSRDDQAPLVANLRKKALEARSNAGLSAAFDGFTQLSLELFLPQSKLESAGDLDNFITGVCDALQAAHPKVLEHLHPTFTEPGNEAIDPKHSILIEDDRRILSIQAAKAALPERQKAHYTVEITEVDS